MDNIRVSAKTKDEAITKALIQLGITSDRLNYRVIAEGKTGLFGIGAKPWIIEASIKESSSENDIKKLEADIDKIKANTASVAVKSLKKNDNDSSRSISEKKEENSNSSENSSVSKASVSDKKEKHTRTDKDKKARRQDKQFNKDYSSVSYDETKEIIKNQHELKPISDEDAENAIHDAEHFITSVLNGMNMEVVTKSEFDHETNELLINLVGSDMGVLIGKRGQTLDSLQYLTSLVVNKNHKEDYIRIKIDTEDYRSRREATLRNLARN
ncbi:MAG: Jag N-terminal domain-containing protein, partial [Eubacterium sp.]|nr:Jag N-terminal domain-containing protein [Eubacterium sp.]